MSNLIGIAGMAVILAIAFAFSSNRKAINLRIVGAALGLQIVIAVIVLYWDKGRRAIEVMSDGVMAVIGYSRAGIDMVFGPLADTEVIGFSFAINVLPIIIFFSALMSVLYHLRVMEWIVKLVGGANVADPNNTFNIGKRNVLAIKKILWQCRMGAVAEDVGKNYGRSVAVAVDTGRVVVTSPGRGDWQI